MKEILILVQKCYRLLLAKGYIQDYYAVDYYVKYKDSILIASQPNLTSSFPISGIKFTEEKSFLKAFIPNNYHSYYYKIYWQDPGLKPSPEIYFLLERNSLCPNLISLKVIHILWI